MAANCSSLSEAELAPLRVDVDRHNGLKDVLAWAAGKPKNGVHPHIVAEVVTQDEFTRDVIVTYKNIFLGYDTT